MLKFAKSRREPGALYDPVDPYDKMFLPVGDIHRLYVEQCGNPGGKPALVLHGGPGAGCSPAMRRFFDPEAYRVVLFDQRGCGRSTPHAEVGENTTGHLVQDMEAIRERLGVERWILFGGSWGSGLALRYAQSHPERVAGIVVRGVFLMTRAEIEWFYGGGAGLFNPEAWERFAGAVPEPERGDLVQAYYKRLLGKDQELADKLARRWVAWETGSASMAGPGGDPSVPALFARAMARIESHYFMNGCFLERDGQLLEDMPLIADIPGHIVQGRYDLVCPPAAARKLGQAWPAAKLRMIPDAGHAVGEPGITRALVEIMDSLR